MAPAMRVFARFRLAPQIVLEFGGAPDNIAREDVQSFFQRHLLSRHSIEIVVKANERPRSFGQALRAGARNCPWHCRPGAVARGSQGSKGFAAYAENIARLARRRHGRFGGCV